MFPTQASASRELKRDKKVEMERESPVKLPIFSCRFVGAEGLLYFASPSPRYHGNFSPSIPAGDK